jgi:hypothetical protein
MEASETSAAGWTTERQLRLFAVIMTSIALAPVAGMLFFFAFVPALPFMLVLVMFMGRMNRIADAQEEATDLKYAPSRSLETRETYGPTHEGQFRLA